MGTCDLTQKIVYMWHNILLCEWLQNSLEVVTADNLRPSYGCLNYKINAVYMVYEYTNIKQVLRSTCTVNLIIHKDAFSQILSHVILQIVFFVIILSFL